MNKEEVLQLYDSEYASTYDDKFIHSELAEPVVINELKALQILLKDGGPWLDVACGTGFFLSKFDVERTGLDISPHMLERAKQAAPEARLFEGSFLDERPEWVGKFRLVTCMWFAYGLVDSIREVARLFQNLSDWTAKGGCLFIPLSNPRALAADFTTGKEFPIPYTYPTGWGGRIKITGLIWSYEEDEKIHANQISVTPEYVLNFFKDKFEKTNLLTYPPSMALLAEGKR